MTFPRALLLSTLLASAALVRAAPFPSTCDLDLRSWGEITIAGTPLSVGKDGKIVVGGSPVHFAPAVCSSQRLGPKWLTEQSKGYLVNANEPSQCLTVSNLDQSGATFSLEDCRFNGAGDVWSSQSFAWIFENDGTSNDADAYFNGENYNVVNASSPPIYTLRTQNTKSNFDGKLGELIADYTPNLTSLPSGQLKIPMTKLPVDAPATPPTLNCSEFTIGQVIFNNETSSSNQYNGPLDSHWNAQSNTSDQFVFEQCDYSPIGLKAADDYVYGRMRPGSNLANGAFECYYISGSFGGDESNKPGNNPIINGFEIHRCSYSAQKSLDIVRYSKSDNTFDYVPFGNASTPGKMYWYAQSDYVREYDVSQYIWNHGKGVGQVYLSPDNANLTKYPPAKVTFKADPAA
ncbi:uncharacterized protein UTRI_05193_B [Ustilago trichophora]|uniref:Uncharacterized protein n=1 Tax=Ustilago trichophora TaxID=86804 RepID=A0A5C3EPK7_9BASI|nr:uncharacterized protein UTRI_05193_B [Ustilago trichophora]